MFYLSYLDSLWNEWCGRKATDLLSTASSRWDIATELYELFI